jgi:hypothetical protein
MSVPWIDPDIRYLDFSDLRKAIGTLEGVTAIIMRGGKPMSVLIPYQTYLQLQALLELPEAPPRTGAAKA